MLNAILNGSSLFCSDDALWRWTSGSDGGRCSKADDDTLCDTLFGIYIVGLFGTLCDTLSVMVMMVLCALYDALCVMLTNDDGFHDKMIL